MKKSMPIIAAAALLLVTGCVPAQPDAPSPAPASTTPAELEALRIGYGLPDCPATDLDAGQIEGGLPKTALRCLGSGTVVNLAGLPRTPTIINLWAQWCAPCRAESPFLREAPTRLKGVSFVGINYDDPQPDWALEFADVVGWSYPHVMDRDKSLRGPLKVPGLPTTYFIDAEGRIAGVHAGQLESEEQLVELAHRYLGTA